MKSSLRTRLAALFLALSFTTATAGREASHAGCPIHDSLGASATQAHASHHAEHAGAPDHGDQHSGCSCLGTCCATSAGIVAAPVALNETAIAVSFVRQPASPAAIALPDAPDYIRPYPSGPPAVLRIA